MNKGTLCRRDGKRKGRDLRRGLNISTAAGAIGDITPGCEIFGVNKGQFSLIDIIEHCLRFTGPADVILSTWTAAAADLDYALRFLADGRVKTLRFVVDFSFPSRQPEYCAALRERFGDDSVRMTKNHAKFVTVTNEDWSIVIRSSMNLNENRRLESFEISDDADLAGYVVGVLHDLWKDYGDGEQFTQSRRQRDVDFENMGGQPETGAARLYFSDDLHGQDLRRIGWSTRNGRVFR